MTNSNNGTTRSSVAQILAERAELDEKIRRDHTQTVSIFFCDIKGYTSYTETHGDLAGLALAQKVTDIAFPALKEFDGNLVKTIGDAIMAYFVDPGQAVRFAAALQQRIKNSNANKPPIDQIHIRIGLNLGEVIIDSGDLFGDAVNIAARIEPQARPDGILISPSLHEAIKDAGDITSRYAKTVTMKGKDEPMALYQVVWDASRYDDYSEDDAAISKPVTTAGEGKDSTVGRGHSFSWKLAASVFAVIVALVVLKVYNFTPEENSPTSDPYISGYSALLNGSTSLAAELFSKLPKNDPRYLEAQAAISLQEKDLSKAELLINDAMKSAGDRVYVHVLQGDLLLKKSLQENAFNAFKKGALLDKGLDWQRAQAYNNMGRILANQNKTEEALVDYSEAARLAPDNGDILTNYGVLLERVGKSDEALKQFQRAVKVNPNDSLALRKLALSEKQAKAKMDQERQKIINTLVDELVAKYKSGAIPSVPGNSQETEQISPSIWVMSFIEKGDLPKREGENEVFSDLLGQQMQESSTINLVERDILESLLTELKLGSSELANRDTSLKLGRLIAANLILSGNIFRRDGILLVNVKIIETETSRILAAVSAEVIEEEGLLRSTDKIAQQILSKLSGIYPQLSLETQSS
jgi:class 3 adenylate cyclase/TolB-like protein